MIQLMKRLLEFSGKQRKNLIASFVFNLLDSVFEMMPIMAILTVLSGLLSVAEGGVMPVSAIWVSLAIMVVSIAGRIFFNNLSCIRRTLGSFSMCSEKRLEIGEHMKHVPMGYFNENRLGEIVAAVTTTLGDIESNAVMVLEKVAGGFIHALVIGVWLLFYEWHIGLLMFAGLAVSMLVYGGIQKAGKRLSPRRQAAQANLVTGFLEYIQGMGVVHVRGVKLGQGHHRQDLLRLVIEHDDRAALALGELFADVAREALGNRQLHVVAALGRAGDRVGDALKHARLEPQQVLRVEGVHAGGNLAAAVADDLRDGQARLFVAVVAARAGLVGIGEHGAVAVGDAAHDHVLFLAADARIVGIGHPAAAIEVDRIAKVGRREPKEREHAHRQHADASPDDLDKTASPREMTIIRARRGSPPPGAPARGR